ncbi:MAG: hypothetical protein R2844_16835 [Caldilineales bacterium]
MNQELTQQLNLQLADLQTQIAEAKEAVRKDEGLAEVEDQKRLEALLRQQKDIAARLNALEEG